MTLLTDVFNYKQWADERAIKAAKKIDGSIFPSEASFICQQLNHMVLVEENFKARLLGQTEPHLANNTEILPTLESLAERNRNSNAWYSAYLQGLDEGKRNEIVSFQFTDKKFGSMSRIEILFHIINHSTYHRGAIGKALDMAGGLRPADTYTVYIHEEEPRRRNRPTI